MWTDQKQGLTLSEVINSELVFSVLYTVGQMQVQELLYIATTAKMAEREDPGK